MKRLLLAAAFCAAATPALALFDQQAPGFMVIIDPASPAAALGTVSHPLNTTGTFTGTIGGFPGGTGGVIGTPVTAVTTVTAGSTQSLPAGTSVIASNPGAVMAFCQLGASASVNSQPIAPGGGWFDFTVGSATQITCVTASSTTTVNTFGGGGIATGTGGGGGAGGGGAITAPLGTQTIANSVAVTPATSSVWSGPLGTQTIANSQAVTPATSSVWAGPLGAQAISNSQAVTPATSSVWSVTNGPNQASITGNITVVDSGVTCAATAASQTQCTGSPTANSFVTGQINGAGCIGVSSALSGGTATATMSTEISQDNVNFYPRGLFLDGKNAPIWINNATGGVFSGLTPGGGVLYYRVRASALSVLTGSPTFAITIVPSQAACMEYIGNLPTSGNGSAATGSVPIQGGGGSALNVGTNQVQQAGVALAAPTAAGSSASGNIQGVQGVTGSMAMPVTGSLSFTQFAPNGTTYGPLSVGASSANVAITGAPAVIEVDNTGANAGFFTLGVGSGTTATVAAGIQVAPGGFKCVGVGSNTYLAGIETAGATSFNIVAGTGGCAGSGGGGGGGGSSGNVFQANLFYTGSTSSAATTQILAASGSTVVYLVNYGEQTDGSAGAAATFQIVTGTGTNCASSQVALTPVWNFPAGQGVQEGSIGVLGVSAAGGALCTKTTTSNQVNWRIGVVQQ